MSEHLEDLKGFVDEHVDFFDTLPKRSRQKVANSIVKHDEHWKLEGRGALE